MGVTGYGAPGDTLASPSLRDWAASVSAALDGSDVSVDDRARMVRFSPDVFGTIDTTGATACDTAFAAFLAAIPDGGMGWVPPGTYLLNSRKTISGKSLAVVASDRAEFVVGTTSGGIQFLGGFEATQTVTTLTERKTTLGEYGNGGANMWVTDLTLSSTAPAWTKGDLIKVVSNDVAPDPDKTPSIKSGQTCVVLEVSGTRVTVMGTMRDEFTTGIRCARYLGHKMSWTGGRFRNTDAILAGTTMCSYMIQAKWLTEPAISRVTVLGANGPGIELRNCFRAQVGEGVTIRRAEDKNSTVYGYGINDAGSEFTAVAPDYVAYRVRHAYTTGGDGIAADNADLGNYGRTYGAFVNGAGYDCSDSSFDTHGDADSIHFGTIRSHNSRSALGLRGTRHVVDSLHVHGKHNAGIIGVSTTSSALHSWGSVIHKAVIDDVDDPDNGIIYVQSDTAETRPTYVGTVIVRSRDATTKPVVKVDGSALVYGTIISPGATLFSLTNGGTATPMSTAAISQATSNVLANNAEGGSNTTVVTNANSGGTSGTAWTTSQITGSPTFSTTFKTSGSLGYSLAAAAGATCTLGWAFDSTTSAVSCRLDFQFSAAPTSADCAMIQFRNASAATVSVGITTAGALYVAESSSSVVSTSSALSTNTRYRLELAATVGTGTGDGVIQCAVYAADSLVPTHTYTSRVRNTGTTAFAQWKVGKVTSATTAWSTLYVDDVRVELGRSSLIGS